MPDRHRPFSYVPFLFLLGAVVVFIVQWATRPGPARTPSSAPAAVAAEAAAAPAATRSVNAVIGDVSYWVRFGRWPGPDADETTRIRTHLAFVEHLLRTRPTNHLSPAQRAARARHLDRLRAYWTRGVFPRNDGFPSPRRPTFIDDAGRLCAVGYLIAQSAGRAVAERINARYKYAYLQTIDAPVLDRWIARSGFTERELAMIQPAYCDGFDSFTPCPPSDHQDAGAPIRSEVEIGLATLNGGVALLNGILHLDGQASPVASGAGLALGGTGLALSLSDRANYPTSSLVLAGASLLASTISLTAAFTDRAGERRHAPLVPTTRVAVVPTRERHPKMQLALEWSF